VATPALPVGSVLARTTPTFDATTVPAGLLAAHETSVWAELVVVDGVVVFVEESSGAATEVVAGERIVIVPHVRRHVEPASSARFFVQFYRSS